MLALNRPLFFARGTSVFTFSHPPRIDAVQRALPALPRCSLCSKTSGFSGSSLLRCCDLPFCRFFPVEVVFSLEGGFFFAPIFSRVGPPFPITPYQFFLLIAFSRHTLFHEGGQRLLRVGFLPPSKHPPSRLLGPSSTPSYSRKFFPPLF